MMALASSEQLTKPVHGAWYSRRKLQNPEELIWECGENIHADAQLSPGSNIWKKIPVNI